MLPLTSATRIYLSRAPMDMRKSFNGLFAYVSGQLEKDPCNGYLYVFCNRRRDRLKILYWDSSGLWVCAKRLESGTFKWPEANGSLSVEYSYQEFNLLLGGFDLKKTKKRKWINH